MSRLSQWLLLSLILCAVLASASGAARSQGVEASEKIEPLVLREVADRGGTDFFVWMTEKADLSPAHALRSKEEKGRFVFETLRATAEQSQSGVRAFLSQRDVSFRPFYIANKILVRGGDEALIMNLAARSDVARITANHQFQLQQPFIDPDPPRSEPAAIESNISFVRADDVWAMGYTGEGIVLAGNDTGLDWDHPALINQYRGWDGTSADHNYNWWDATGTYPDVPNDGNGHGTHITGTMVGDDGGSNQIGMAPGAQTIHCKNMTNFGSGSDATFTECFEWDLAPWDLSGANPDPDLAPDAINNSWGYFGGGASQFEDEIAALQAAGIAVEVSAGNEGPGCSSLRSPGDYAEVITTGSVNHFGGSLPGTITSFSSRGPSDLYPGEFVPDIMAPGENINSSLPGGGYSGPTWSGTSMAGPHVVGLIGLMWSASPAIRGDIDTTYGAIFDTAVRLSGQSGSNCGGDYADGPNHDWGYGTIDSVAAVQEAIALGGPDFTLAAAPEAQSICAGTSAVYQVDIGQILGYTDPVTLSASGHPAGSSANFSVNPVTPPGTSNLGIGNTGGVAPGEYNVEILGVAPTSTHTTTVGLSVFTNTPGAVTLVGPADGASGVELAPTFEWTAASQADSYTLVVATALNPGAIVYTAEVDGTSHTIATPLEPLTNYFWAVRATNPCGNGAISPIFDFMTMDIPPVLVVDDDDNSPNVQGTYTSILDNLGVPYDVWDTNNSDNEPGSVTLLQYDYVVWFTGDEFGGAAGPGSDGESALATFLDSGDRCLFLSSQDYHWDRGLTSFMQDYLGAGSVEDDVSQTQVTGQLIYSDLGTISLVYGFSNYSDEINPSGPGTATVWSGNQGSAAIGKKTASYATMWMGFPLEAMPDAADRSDTLSRFLAGCR